MEFRQEIRGFLMSRRARITPEQAGLPYVAGHRRVQGLRREEVAMLAGLSVEYYTRMERGRIGGASESVLDAVAGALQLDDDERAHLYDLARNVAPGARRKRPQRTSPITASVQQVLDSMSVPAVIQNGRLDLLAANNLGRARYVDLFTTGRQPPNLAGYVVLDPRAQAHYTDLDEADRQVTELIGELSTRSSDFSARWARHDLRRHSRDARSSTTRPSAGWTSRTTTSPCPATRTSRSPPTPRFPERPARTASPCRRPGPRRRRSRERQTPRAPALDPVAPDA